MLDLSWTSISRPTDPSWQIHIANTDVNVVRHPPGPNAPIREYPSKLSAKQLEELRAVLTHYGAHDYRIDNLATLRGRIVQLGPHPVVTETLAKFDAAVETFSNALKSEEAAEALEESLFQEELQARKAIREQLEVAYGKLRVHYKANPRKAEDFFLREGSRRKPK